MMKRLTGLDTCEMIYSAGAYTKKNKALASAGAFDLWG